MNKSTQTEDKIVKKSAVKFRTSFVTVFLVLLGAMIYPLLFLQRKEHASDIDKPMHDPRISGKCLKDPILEAHKREIAKKWKDTFDNAFPGKHRVSPDLDFDLNGLEFSEEDLSESKTKMKRRFS
jgi:hypothetical protein